AAPRTRDTTDHQGHVTPPARPGTGRRPVHSSGGPRRPRRRAPRPPRDPAHRTARPPDRPAHALAVRGAHGVEPPLGRDPLRVPHHRRVRGGVPPAPPGETGPRRGGPRQRPGDVRRGPSHRTPTPSPGSLPPAPVPPQPRPPRHTPQVTSATSRPPAPVACSGGG